MKGKMVGKEAAVYVLLFGLVFQTTFGFLETLGIRAKRSLGTVESCHELSKKFENCTSKLSWNLRDLPSFTNCHRKDSLNSSICVENALCKKSEFMDWDAFENKAVSCPKDETMKKVLFLKILCSSKGTCVKGLIQNYLVHRADWNNSTKLLHHFNSSSVACCFGSLINLYNASGNVTELLQSTWVMSGLKVPQKCLISKQIERKVNTTLVSSTTQPSTLKTTQNTKTSLETSSQDIKTTQVTKIETTTKVTETKVPAKKSSSGISSKLKASLVIASIIFIVLAVVVTRFVYHRIQRRKMAKYEDYGYSQLKVILDDNLYEDDEDDDDQLLSAT
ncbi:uncharacterized protein LOC135682483 [Rhopilema esculentum]|uniref:uncharacterized protein LOC135682483 n=1 Tax=Rhopilema esculentum TaxID=499914 RepID=UPI0031DD82F8